MAAAAARFKRGIMATLGKGVGSHYLKLGGLLAVALAASAAVTATTTPTNTHSVALVANEIDDGTVIEVEAQGIATAANGTDTLAVDLKLGGVTICSIAATDVAANDIYRIRATIVIRTDGAGGTLVATGEISNLAANGTAVSKPFFKASTAIDTTGALTLAVVHTWSTNNAGNSSRNDVFVAKRYGFEGAVGVEA